MRAPLCDLDKTKQGDPKSCDFSFWLLFTATSNKVATQTCTHTHTNTPTFLSLSLVSGKEVDGEAFAALEGQRLIQAIQAFSGARLCCDVFPFWFSSISSVGGSSLFEGTPHRIVPFKTRKVYPQTKTPAHLSTRNTVFGSEYSCPATKLPSNCFTPLSVKTPSPKESFWFCLKGFVSKDRLLSCVCCRKVQGVASAQVRLGRLAATRRIHKKGPFGFHARC